MRNAKVRNWVVVFGALLLMVPNVTASASNFPPEQASGSIGLEGRISTEPPKQGATITTPGNGANFTNLPITINGLCPSGLLVKVFANNVFIGSADCPNGSYSIKADIFSGQNQLVARVYDSLDQAGPDSNTVNVTFSPPEAVSVSDQLFLTSLYARRGAPPGSQLIWPIILTGGNGPYAVSVDWGDGTSPDLQTQTFAGTFNITHTYKTAGTYQVIVKATDSKGQTAILQLSAVATGAVSKNDNSGNNIQVIRTDVLWWPCLLMLPLIVAAYWLGKRSELYSLRKTLEKSRSQGLGK